MIVNAEYMYIFVSKTRYQVWYLALNLFGNLYFKRYNYSL